MKKLSKNGIIRRLYLYARRPLKMPQTTSKQKLEEKLIKEIEKSLFVSRKDKELLLGNIDNFPRSIMQSLLKQLKGFNNRAEQYAKLAMEDKETLAEFEKDVKAATNKFKNITETKEKGEAEDFLENQLNQIDEGN